jgi:hypothetical protein
VNALQIWVGRVATYKAECQDCYGGRRYLRVGRVATYKAELPKRSPTSVLTLTDALKALAEPKEKKELTSGQEDTEEPPTDEETDQQVGRVAMRFLNYFFWQNSETESCCWEGSYAVPQPVEIDLHPTPSKIGSCNVTVRARERSSPSPRTPRQRRSADATSSLDRQRLPV